MANIVSTVHIAEDLQLSIKDFGTDGLIAADRQLCKTFDLRTAVCVCFNHWSGMEIKRGSN
jgi:hypothetical protein